MDARIPVFRVFVSSTFEDFAEERDALQTGAFARLRAYCVERGARFQAIDLRWGVSDLASIDQQALPICLRELDRCLQPTPRPNFVVLLGERYGWRPLPNTLDVETFDALRRTVTPRERRRFERWYRRDDNAVPPRFVLLRRESRSRVPGVWAREESGLREAALRAAGELGWPPDDPRVDAFARSATHHEIAAGALSERAPSDGVFAYLRHSEGQPRRRFARRYVEQPERVAALKQALRSQIPAGQVHAYALTWPQRFWQRGTPEIDLTALGDRVEADLRGAIDRELGALEDLEPTEREEREHRDFLARRTRGFVGRDTELARIADYLATAPRGDGPDAATQGPGGTSRPDEAGVPPLFVIGPSGSGKSALMARAASDVDAIARFVSATPATATLQGLLTDLCHQLGRRAGWPATDPPDGAGALRTAFLDALEAAAPVVVFLDAVDQLDPADRPASLTWLPTILPAGVRIVVSVLERPGEPAGEAAERARDQYPAEAFLQVPALDASHGEIILDARLTEEERTLTTLQRSRVLEGFAANGRPLYLQLAIEGALHWRSWDAIDTPLPPTIRGLLDRLFDRLVEVRGHDPGLVARVLGNLAASTNGLSEGEILDLLAADEAWFGAFRRSARHRLPEGRRTVPVIVWARLLGDLEPYLTERAADGTQLYGFYHRQVAEAAADRFLDRNRHQALADYFAAQPTVYRTREGLTRVNRRQLSEVPVQLRGAGDLPMLVETLADPDLVDASVRIGRRYPLLMAMQQAHAEVGDPLLRRRLAHAVVEASLDPDRAPDLDPTFVHDALVYQGDTTFYRSVLDAAAHLPDRGDGALRPFQLGLANVLRRDGELARAAPLFERVLEDLDVSPSGGDATLSRTLYEIGYVHYLRGDFEPAVTRLEQSADASPLDDDGQVSGWISRCVASVVALHGGMVDPDAVLAVLELAESNFARHAQTGHPAAERWVMNTQHHTVEIHLDRGHLAQAQTAYATFAKSKWFAQFGRDEVRVRELARLRSLEGQHDEARALYRSYLDTFADRDVRTVQAYARYLLEWATILERAGDAEASHAALELAAAHPAEPGNHLWKETAQGRLSDR